MKPKRFFFVLLGIFGAIALLTGGGYYLALQQLHTKKAALSTSLAEQAEADSRIERLGTLKRQYDRDITPVIPLLDEALPRSKKQTEILAQLQLIAAQVGLQITSVSMPSPLGLPAETSQTIKSGVVFALPINFQLSGTYEQLQTFTARVEKLNRFTNVTNLAITRPDKSKPVVYSISLNAYIMP